MTKPNRPDTTDRRNMFYWQVDRPFDASQTKEIFLDRHANFDPKLAAEVTSFGLKKAGFSHIDANVRKIHDVIAFGSVNVVYKARVGSGIDVITRIHPPGVKNGYFWVEKLAARAARMNNVPAYETYIIDDTRKGFPFDYMVIECLKGNSLQSYWPLSVGSDRKLMYETGQLLSRIHGVKTENFGFFDNKIAKTQDRLVGIHQSMIDHVSAAFDLNLDYLTDNKVMSVPDRRKVEGIFTRNIDLIRSDSPRLIQNDLADWNQLSDGAHISGIVDWDECFSGDPVMDFSAWSVFFSLERMRHLMDGYTSERPLPNGFEEKFHLYRLRYIVSKAVTRKKKIMPGSDSRYQQMLDYALSILQDEFKWYGV